MSGIKGNKIAKFLLVMGVMMQVMAMLPHHHHAGEETACINFLHVSHNHDSVAGQDCCGNCCGDDHGHDNDPFTVCNSHNLVITQPQRESNETREVEITLPDDCHCLLCVLAIDSHISEYTTARLENEFRHVPDAEPPVMRIIGRSRSPRAPDFLA